MAALDQRDIEQHVSILGWLHIVGNGLFLVVGVFVFMLLTGISTATNDAEARTILPIVGSSVGGLLVALGLPGLLAGYGLLTRRGWSRVLAIVVGILSLVNFPIGTAIGLYTLWVLLQSGVTEYFQQVSHVPGHA